jgi:hypothetical protein
VEDTPLEECVELQVEEVTLQERLLESSRMRKNEKYAVLFSLFTDSSYATFVRENHLADRDVWDGGRGSLAKKVKNDIEVVPVCATKISPSAFFARVQPPPSHLSLNASFCVLSSPFSQRNRCKTE